MAGWYKDYNAPTDRKVAKRMLKIAREHMTDLPSFYTEIVDKEFNGDTDAMWIIFSIIRYLHRRKRSMS